MSPVIACEVFVLTYRSCTQCLHYTDNATPMPQSAPCGPCWPEAQSSCTEGGVASLHADERALSVQYFAVNGVTAAIVPLPTMEANKDFELVFELARQMEHFKLNRYATVTTKALFGSMAQ